MAHRFGLSAGFALDLSVNDPDDGLPWDFDNPEKKAKALNMVREQQPMLLIGSPMCKALSILQSLIRAKMGEVRWHEIIEKGMRHVRCCCEMYMIRKLRKSLNKGATNHTDMFTS